MIKILIIVVMFGCIVLNTFYYIKKKYKKQTYYKTPKLSSLKGKKFKEYIDDLTKDL